MTKWFTRHIFFPLMEKIHEQNTLIYLKELPIKQFRIIQEDEKTIKIKIVKYDNFSKANLDYILNTITHIIGEDINLNCEFVDDIPPTQSGKRSVVIWHVSMKIQESNRLR